MTHVYFCNTPRKHEPNEKCWCGPKKHPVHSEFCVHGNVATHKSVNIEEIIAKGVSILNQWEETK